MKRARRRNAGWSPRPRNVRGRLTRRSLSGSSRSIIGLHIVLPSAFAGKHEDACDITQQAFYIAQTRDHQLRETSKRKPWLFTILHREFLSSRRRQTQYPDTNLESVESELPPITVDHAASLDAKTVLSVLQTLEESFKSALALFYLEQLSYKEIAEVLEIPIGTVMSRLARGKEMLRQRLERTRAENAGKIRPLGATTARKADHG